MASGAAGQSRGFLNCIVRLQFPYVSYIMLDMRRKKTELLYYRKDWSK